MIEDRIETFRLFFSDFKTEERFDLILKHLGFTEDEAQEIEYINVEIRLLDSKRLVKN